VIVERGSSSRRMNGSRSGEGTLQGGSRHDGEEEGVDLGVKSERGSRRDESGMCDGKERDRE
jgi:hypothetical protein